MFFLYILNLFYVTYLLLASTFFLLLLPLFIIGLSLTKNFGADAFRIYNHLYGVFLIKISWPILRIDREGLSNLPDNSSCVVVVNHRSTLDIFFASLFTPANTTIFVRSWPFRIWLFKWFMRSAGYIDIENTPLKDFLDSEGMYLYKKKVSFVLFPEGHRSRDGKLQRFQSGAFLTATSLDIPVIPVLLTGTEIFLPMNRPVISPAKVNIKILPPIYPSSFPEDKRALKLRRHVETIFREQLDG